MAKVDYSDVPDPGTKWDLAGALVTVTGFKAHGKGGHVFWDTYGGVKGETRWREFVKQAKAA